MSEKKLPKVEQITVDYTQPPDTCSFEDQFIQIKTEYGGGGIYYVIKTERWAVDDFDEIIQIFEDFKMKMSNQKQQS